MKYFESIRQSHNDMLDSWGNEILESLASKEITPKEAKEMFEQLKGAKR